MSHCQGLSTSCHMLLPSFPPPPPRSSGMKNGILPPAPQEPLAQILQAYPMRTPKYRAGWLTYRHTYASPGYICSSSISYEMVHCNRHNLALLVPFSVSLPEPRARPGEPHQAFLRNQPPSVQLRPGRGVAGELSVLYLTGVGGTHSTWPPLTWSLTAPLTEPEIASLPPTLREAGSGSCCAVLGRVEWGWDTPQLSLYPVPSFCEP